MQNLTIKDKDFLLLKELIYKKSGINITNDMHTHLQNKLYDRLLEKKVKSFREYYEYLLRCEDELQNMINAVTTNETYFFRELKHFEFMKDVIIPKIKYEKFRCWSAAGSNGAEAYSIAMEIDANLSSYQNWEVVASDINSDMLIFSKHGVYPKKYIKNIPIEYLKSYCLKGQNEDEGFFRINDKLKQHIVFKHINLMDRSDYNIEMFDLVFLRNMIIYFDDKDKKTIVENVLKYLKVGGYLFMGHSESLYRMTNKVAQIYPSIYQKL